MNSSQESFCDCDIPPLRFSHAVSSPHDGSDRLSSGTRHLKLTDDRTVAERLHPETEFSGALLWTNRPLLPGEAFRVQILRLSPKWSGSLTIGLTPIPPQSLPAPSSILSLQGTLSDTLTERPRLQAATNNSCLPAAVVSGVRSLLQETYLVTGASLLRGRNVTISPFTSFNLEDLQTQDVLSLEFDHRGALFLSRNGNLIADSSDGSLLLAVGVPRFGILDMYGVVSKTSSRGAVVIPLFLIIRPTGLPFALSLVAGLFTLLEIPFLLGLMAAVVYDCKCPYISYLFCKAFDLVVVLAHIGAAIVSSYKQRFSPETEENHPAVVIVFMFCLLMTDSFGFCSVSLALLYQRSPMCKLTQEVQEAPDEREELSSADDILGELQAILFPKQGPPADAKRETTEGKEGVKKSKMMMMSTVRLLPPDLPAPLSTSCLNLSVEDLGQTPPIRFHKTCGPGVVVTNGGMAAWKPNPESSYNQSIVLTSRPLTTNELFEVSLDSVCSRWCGCLEIGVTLNSPDLYGFPDDRPAAGESDGERLKKSPRTSSSSLISSSKSSSRSVLPPTLTAMPKPTWLFTSKMVVVHGCIANEEYSRHNSLDDLEEGDTIGVLRKSTGDLHFFVNGKDLGVAARNVPPGVYGVVDLYGKTAGVSIVPRPPFATPPRQKTVHSLLRGRLSGLKDDAQKHRFSDDHGSHVWLSLDGRTARRKPGYTGGFLRGATFLVPGVPFEVQVDALDIRWPGSICIGASSPEAMIDGGGRRETDAVPEFKFADSITLHPLVGQRYALTLLEDSILALSRNGKRLGVLDVRNGGSGARHLYPCFVLQGCILGISLPCSSLHPSSLSSPGVAPSACRRSTEEPPKVFRFDPLSDRNISVSPDQRRAIRFRGYGASLVMAKEKLARGETFQVLITDEVVGLAPAMTIGLLERSLAELSSAAVLPLGCPKSDCPSPSEEEMIVKEVSSSILALRLGGASILVNGNTVYENIAPTHKHSGPSLGALAKGHIVGLRHSRHGKISLLIDGAEYPLDTLLPVHPEGWYPVMDLCGTFSEVMILNGSSGSEEEGASMPMQEELHV
ncbi:unnamed protein product [Cyprideis torosa]|uniref:Uncharacterized protein n=1 Tax=Cyprideis torosa TaxID=163714 RepID=A0A7R8WHU2_9CRUS|nr:unnamed protein product [Cyprideis torosa]CAG0893717.1 unnamed protein product [Cyprideis torosa]